MGSPSGARDGLSSVTRGTFLLLVGSLAYVALNFVARFILIRSISTDEWSAFYLALTLVGVFAAFGSLGLPSAIARSLPYAATDAERRTMVRGTLIVGTAAAIAVSVALGLLGSWIASSLNFPDLVPALELFPVAVGTSIVASLIAAIFQGYEDVVPNALYIQTITPGLFVAFLVAVLLLPPYGIDYLSALLAYVLANVVALLLTVVYTLRWLPRRLAPGPRAPSVFGPLMRFATPLLLVTLMSTVIGSGDTLVLGSYYPGAVGTYGASLTLARLLQVGVGAAGYIFLPVAARLLRNRDASAIRLTYVTVTKWMILFSLPLFLLFVFLPARSLDFVYTSKYAVILLPLQITVTGAFLTTAFGPASNAQVAFAQTRLLAYNSVAAAAVDLGVAFALVPSHGMTGAAIAWALANVVYTGLSLAELALLTGVHPFRPHFLVPLVATSVPVAAFLVLAPFTFPLWSLPVLGFGIAALLVLVVLLTRSVDEGDRLLLGAVESLVGRPLPLLRRIGRFGVPAPRS